MSSKVISKAEGRFRRLGEVDPSARAAALARASGKDAALVEIILGESRELVRAARGILICETRHGFVCANAGVDGSNVPGDGVVLLLPVDPDRSARELRAALDQSIGVAPAVVIADSFGRPWRLGQTDIAIGAAGLSVLDDLRGRSDRHGHELHATVIAVADAVAGAADLARTKDSGEPVVIVSGLGRHVTRLPGPGAAALRRPRADDLFR